MAEQNKYVNTKTLCAVLDITAQHVTRLVEKKVLKKVATGKWNLAENVQSFIRYQKKMVADEYEKKINDIKNDTSENNPDTRLTLLKIMKQELELSKEMEQVIMVEDVISYLASLAAITKNAIGKIAKRFGKNIQDVKERKQYQNEIEILTDQSLMEIRSANIRKNIPSAVGDTQENY